VEKATIQSRKVKAASVIIAQYGKKIFDFFVSFAYMEKLFLKVLSVDPCQTRAENIPGLESLLFVDPDYKWKCDCQTCNLNDYSYPFSFHCVAKHYGEN
jgi:hypothetical protein